jgi:diaminopimelate decarboxylase
VGEGLLSRVPVVTETAVPLEDPAALFADAGLERAPDGLLRLGGVSVEAIAKDVGTPAYLYHAGAIRARYREIETAFSGLASRIHYAVKANGNLAVLKLLHDLGAGADIVSLGELRRAQAVGFTPASIVFSGVGKSDPELIAAVEANIASINLESADELAALERLVANRPLTRPVAVAIRVNPVVATETHPYITTGARGMKFGVPGEQVAGLGRRIGANPRLSLTGLAMHLGSQLLDPTPFVRGTERLIDLVEELRAGGIKTISTLDLGGGLGIRYSNEHPVSPEELARAVRPLVEPTGLSIHLEPGRYLVGSAGILVTKVLYRKRSGGKDFVVVDAAMNDLVRPSHYLAHHAIVEVTAQRRLPNMVDVVGPVCESGDFLALDRELADPAPGETLAILGAGAYGFVMASNYNARPRPPEVMVDRGRFAVVRPREKPEDLFRGEIPDPFAR